MKALLFFLALLLVGCPPSRGPSFVKGKKLFEFEYKKVSVLKVAKHDPFMGEFWNMTAKRDNNRWVVDSASVQPAPLDKELDTNRIEHVLDTISSLVVQNEAPAGKLDVFGLEPAHYTLEFTADNQNHLLQIGSRESGTRLFYAQAQAPGHKKVSPPIVLSGTTLSILEHWDRFQSVRLNLFVGRVTDDVDAIKIFRGAQNVFTAERSGDDWIDAKKKPIKKKVTDFLDRLLMAEITKFQDNPEENARIVKETKTNPSYRIELEGLNIKATLWLKKEKSGTTWATQSLRDGKAFELHSKLWLDWKEFLGDFPGL